MLDLEILGGFTLRDSQGAPLALPKKARALLAYLALAEGRPQPRERLAALLWEDGADDQARTNLRQSLAVLRRSVPGAGWLVADLDAVAIDPAAFRIDAVRFQALAAGDAAQQAEAAALYRGDLLDSLHIVESGFESWLAAERARLRDTAIRLLETTAAAALADRRTDAALALAGRLVALDPLHEAGCRLAMQACVQAGRTGEALRQYRQLQARLRRDLGVAPEAETTALHHDIAGRRRQRATPRVAVGEHDPDDAAPPDAPAEAPARAADPVQARRELRRMAVLSAGIAGYARLSAECDLEHLHRLLAAWHAAIAEETARAGGVVHETMGDTALAVFGRDRASDDDPARALAAALAIHRRMPALAAAVGTTLQARIGLAAGPMLLTEAGTGNAIIGEAMTAAANLRALAEPGATLMADAFRAEIGDTFRAEIGDAAGAAPPPLFGRAAEQRQLTGLLAIVCSGAGASVCLRGEPGIGKSRLADAIIAAARDRGVAVHCAQLADFGPLSTQSPRRQLARSLLGLDGGDGLDDGLERNPFALALGAARLPWLYQLTGSAAPRKLGHQVEANLAADPAAARAESFRLLLGTAAAETPLLLVVEDVHWATPDALRQLADLTHAVETLPVLLMLTSRSEPDQLDLAWRATAGALITIDLRPLAESDSTALAQDFAGVPAEAAATCVARANGNPLFLTQLLAAVRDGASAATALPGSVQSLTLGRMDGLGAAERHALRAAAVLGQRVPIAAVAAVADLDGYAPSPAVLGTLVTSDGERLRFVHALVRDAIYASLLESERAALHRAAAAWYHGRDVDLVAEHLAGAREPDAAAAFAAAANAALARHRADKALAAVARGLALAGDGAAGAADRHRLKLVESAARARALDLAGAADAAVAAAADAPDPLGRAQALILQATALSGRQQADAALAVLGEAEAAAGDVAGSGSATTAHAETLARIHALRGNIHFPLGRLDVCLDAHRQSLLWSKRAGTAIAEAGALVGLAWAHYQRGDFAAGEREASACLAIAGDDAFDRIRLSALRVRAVCRVFLLAHAGGLDDATAAIALAREQGDVVNECLARTTAGTIHLEQWQHDAALAMVEPALQLGDRLGAIGLDAAPLWVKGTAVGALGDGAAARAILEQARAQGLRGKAIRFAVPRIIGTLAFFVPAARRPELVAEGEALLARAGVAHSAFGFYGSLVHIGLRDADWDLADRCAAGLARYAGPDPAPWAAALVTMTRLFAAVGRGEADAETAAAAARFHADARRNRALHWLRPAMTAVEAHATIGVTP